MDLKNTKISSHFFYCLAKPVLFCLMLSVVLSVSFSCSRSSDVEDVAASENKPKTVVKKRDDGAISSVNQVDENDRVHGIRATHYEDGNLSAEFESEKGNVLPGLKEYKKDGTLVTSYPEIQFREIDLLASKNRVGECPGQEV